VAIHSLPGAFSYPPSGPIPMRVFGIVCLNDHSHYLNFRPGFRSLNCFLARACHDLIWIAIVAIRSPPSLSSAPAFSRTHQLRFRQPHNSTALLVRPHFRFRTHIRYLACIQSLQFHGHQSLRSGIACIEHSLEPKLPTRRRNSLRLSLKSFR
jgi:hypothetical protein